MYRPAGHPHPARRVQSPTSRAFPTIIPPAPPPPTSTSSLGCPHSLRWSSHQTRATAIRNTPPIMIQGRSANTRTTQWFLAAFPFMNVTLESVVLWCGDCVRRHSATYGSAIFWRSCSTEPIRSSKSTGATTILRQNISDSDILSHLWTLARRRHRNSNSPPMMSRRS